MVAKLKQVVEKEGIIPVLHLIISSLALVVLSMVGYHLHQQGEELKSHRNMLVTHAVDMRANQIKDSWQDSQIKTNTDQIRVLKQCSVKTKENFSKLESKGVL